MPKKDHKNITVLVYCILIIAKVIPPIEYVLDQWVMGLFSEKVSKFIYRAHLNSSYTDQSAVQNT